MSANIKAELGSISNLVLLPGDPLRTKVIAEHHLRDATCYSSYRNMFGFTGKYGDNLVSVQSSGIGIPSAAIYIEELIREYKVKKIIRIGTCGALQKDLEVGTIVIPMTASTDSNFNRVVFNGFDFAPFADFELLKCAYDLARNQNIKVKIGSVLTTDTLYSPRKDLREPFAEHNVSCVDMETAALYSLACRYNVRAISVLLVTSNRHLNARMTSNEIDHLMPMLTSYCLNALVSN